MNKSHQRQVDEAKALLESVALLEKVAATREAKAEKIMGALAEGGMTRDELAAELDISKESTGAILGREAPKPPHERVGISEESVEKLDPLASEASEAV